MLKRGLVFLFVLCSFFSFAQNDSCKLRISVLTCAPGEELYSTFGHTAVRIYDSTTGRDLVFNYGTFDFSDPNFYVKFVRGKLEYFLSYDELQNFLYTYQVEKRSVVEQVLNISCEEKQALYQAIITNLQGENKFYRYDFLYDNCTSRVRDLLERYTSKFNISSRLIPEGTTSRDLLHEYLDKGQKPWSKLGIDILLGSKLDDTISNRQAMFLPDYLMKGITAANNGGLQLQMDPVYTAEAITASGGNFIPLIILSIFSLIVIFISLRAKNTYPIALKIVDSFIFYATGILGFLLLFMWFGTDHSVCQQNYNLLWALPTHLVAAFFLFSKKLWVKRYFFIAACIHAISLLLWFFLPQELNIALVPFVILLMFRSYQLSK